ncbi:Uncharacterised protein [Mycobacteroides abscessus subsp. abscessus]|nr:Uncharacterised protein [Mycobacteroides abscessus subsp. abscessus]
MLPKNAPTALDPNSPPIAISRKVLRILFGKEVRLTGKIVRKRMPALIPCMSRPAVNVVMPSDSASSTEPSRKTSTKVR